VVVIIKVDRGEPFTGSMPVSHEAMVEGFVQVASKETGVGVVHNM
jgi:hypothetical protein